MSTVDQLLGEEQARRQSAERSHAPAAQHGTLPPQIRAIFRRAGSPSDPWGSGRISADRQISIYIYICMAMREHRTRILVREIHEHEDLLREMMGGTAHRAPEEMHHLLEMHRSMHLAHPFEGRHFPDEETGTDFMEVYVEIFDRSRQDGSAASVSSSQDSDPRSKVPVQDFLAVVIERLLIPAEDLSLDHVAKRLRMSESAPL